MKTLMTNPATDGYHMPAEFTRHRGSILLWPERRDIWRDGARPVQFALVKLVEAIAEFEEVIVGVTSNQFMNAKGMLPDNVTVYEVSYNDVWVRDTGPTFVTNGESIRGVDWIFNAWGGLIDGSYFPWDMDELLPQKILEWFRADRYKVPLVLEGGAFHVDGEGTLIAIKECVLNINRNPNVSLDEIERILGEYLRVKKFIWLERGLYLEENNGHIDNMCAFARPGEVLLAWCDDKCDPQYEISREAYEILSEAKDAKGRHLIIHKVLLPEAMHITVEESKGIEGSQFALPRRVGDRLPASYVNFYFVNGGVIIPKFNRKEDVAAHMKFKEIFPDRTVVQIDVNEFLIGGGGLHCLVAQVPDSSRCEEMKKKLDG